MSKFDFVMFCIIRADKPTYFTINSKFDVQKDYYISKKEVTKYVKRTEAKLHNVNHGE